jgi:hypothetical protein
MDAESGKKNGLGVFVAGDCVVFSAACVSGVGFVVTGVRWRPESALSVSPSFCSSAKEKCQLQCFRVKIIVKNLQP